jgi:hypothetical protein
VDVSWPSPRRLRAVTDRVARRSDTTAVARLGLVARTGFYLLLAGLCVAVAVHHGHGPQVNAHGALALVAGTPLGTAAIAATALGFFLLGAVRVRAAARDSDGTGWRRAGAGLQGAFYLAITAVPVSFLLGQRGTGTESQQHRDAARVLGLPGGRGILVAAGVVVLVVSAWQIRTAARQDFTDGMDIAGCRDWVRTTIVVTGTTGIVARALVFAPVGVFLVVAAVQADPRHADGLDAELATLAREPFGPVVLAAVALGLLVFAAYSGLEARFRDLGSSG